MNQIFSFKRFLLLVLKHWADNKKRYGLSVLAFFGLLSTWFLFSMLTGFDDIPMGKSVQTITFFFSLFAVGTFYASQYFSELGSRSKGINFLLVPASAFEKLLCGLLYSIVLFFLVFTATFYLVDIIMVGIAKLFTGTAAGVAKSTVVNVFHIIVVPVNMDTTLNFLLFYFSIQSAFLLGSIYFEKYSFIKTVIACFGLAFIFFFLIYFFNEHLLPDGTFFKGFFTSYLVLKDGANDQLVQIPAWIGQMLRFLVLYGIAPFLWIVTYYRLKEKQV